MPEHNEIDIHTFVLLCCVVFFSVSTVVDGRGRPSRCWCCCLLMKIESFNLSMSLHCQQKWRHRKRIYSVGIAGSFVRLRSILLWCCCLLSFVDDDVCLFVFFSAISLVCVMYCQAKWIFIRIHIGFGWHKHTHTHTLAHAKQNYSVLIHVVCIRICCTKWSVVLDIENDEITGKIEKSAACDGNASDGEILM